MFGWLELGAIIEHQHKCVS